MSTPGLRVVGRCPFLPRGGAERRPTKVMAPGRWPGGVAVPRADPGQPPMVQSLTQLSTGAPLYLPGFPFGFPSPSPGHSLAPGSRMAFWDRASSSSSLASSIILSQSRAEPAARTPRRISATFNSHILSLSLSNLGEGPGPPGMLCCLIHSSSPRPLSRSLSPGFSCSENSTPIKHRGRALNPPLLRHASAAAPSTLTGVVRRPGSQHPGPWY